MAKAIMKMSPGMNGSCWDKLVVTVNSSSPVARIIRFRDRNSALGAYNQIAIAAFEDHTGSLIVEIDNTEYKFSYEEWQAIGGALDKWYEDYMFVVEKI